MTERKAVLSLLAATIAFSVSCSAEGVSRLYLEAEDCEGLQRYPFHNEDAKGWYAREANVRGYGAPGRSYYAAIHENTANRTMTARLERPVPPGKYRVALRIMGPGMEADSAVEVKIGKTPVKIVWRHKGKRAAWLPFQEVVVEEPADSVSFTAAQFGGSNHGGLYNPLNGTLWLDTLYVTNDANEASPPDIVTERYIRAGIDPQSVPARKPHLADETGPNLPQTPGPVGEVVDTPIFLEAFDGRRNLWPNSSFELGMNDGWAATASSHVFTDADLCRDKPFHGAYCLAVRGKSPFSRPYRLEKAGKVTFSVYVRGNGQPVSVFLKRNIGRGDQGYTRVENTKPAVVLKAEGKADAEWSRFVATGDLQPGWYYLAFEGGECLADAVQLEYGEKATDYEPRAEVEGALRTGQVGNIIHDGAETLDLWLHSSAKTPRKADLRFQIVDVRERVVAEGATEPAELGPGQTLTKPLPILPKLRGMFSVSFAADGRKGVDGETVYVVMPKPSDKPTRHTLGGNIGPGAEWEMAVQSRLGLKWVLTCKSRQFAAASEGAHPKPEVWNWYDDAAALPAKYGMFLQPALWPDRVPDFMLDKPSRRSRSVRGFGGPRPHALKLDLWKEHVAKVVEHYKDQIKWWCIDDEAEGNWDPCDFAEMAEATCDTVHQAAPGVKIGFSGWVDFQEEVMHFMPVDKLDFFGSSTFDLNYEEGRAVRHFARRYGRPYFCYGVGGRPPMHTMYHTLYHFLPPYPKAARMAQRVVNLLLVQDVTCAGHYAAVFTNYGVHYALNKPLCDYDGTPLPWGATFGCLGTLLADAEPVDHVPLGDTDRLAHVFRVGERYGFTTYATNVRHFDLHYRPAEREIKGMAFPCPEGSVEVVDMYWNPHPAARWADGALTLDLNEEPVFVLDKSLGRDGLLRMIADSKRPPSPCEMSMAFAPGSGTGRLDVEVTLKNMQDKDLRNVTIDLRHSTDPFTFSGHWLLASPYTAVGDIAPGATRNVRLPTVLDGRSPCEDARMRIHLYAADGIQLASDHWLWLIPAVKEPKVTIDGRLDEWQSLPAAWLAYVWTNMPMARHQIQLYENPEHFSYPSYRLDARAMFWAGYDEKQVYVGIRLEDDDPVISGEKSEKIRLILAIGERTVALDLLPLADGSVRVQSDSGTAAGVQARCSQVTETIHNGADLKATTIQPILIEAAIPWANIGITPEPGQVIGFDLFWTDIDHEGADVAEGTLRWAGGAANTGFLLLREK